MIGSMGLAASIGLGLALARPERRVVVLDGDGNLLMGLGALADGGRARPRPASSTWSSTTSAYASTGGQRSIADAVDLAAIAAAPATRTSAAWTTRPASPPRSTTCSPRTGPAFLLVKVDAADPAPPAPRVAIPQSDRRPLPRRAGRGGGRVTPNPAVAGPAR